ncbi:MAG: hypothetical protein ACFE0P_00835 [Oceanicaulis sp.]
MQYLTSNALFRVARIRRNVDGKEIIGTAFFIEHNDREYLISAKHNFHDQTNDIDPAVFRDFVVDIETCAGKGKLPLKYIIHAADVIAFATPHRIIHKNYKVLNSSDTAILGQDVFIPGFPYGWHMDIKTDEGSGIAPFIKSGCLSAILSDQRFYIDGFFNKGFSGSPVYFFNAAKKLWSILGVFTGYHNERLEMVSDQVGEIYSNAGFGKGYIIKLILEEIDATISADDEPNSP